jgi:hypothetical protein
MGAGCASALCVEPQCPLTGRVGARCMFSSVRVESCIAARCVFCVACCILAYFIGACCQRALHCIVSSVHRKRAALTMAHRRVAGCAACCACAAQLGEGRAVFLVAERRRDALVRSPLHRRALHRRVASARVASARCIGLCCLGPCCIGLCCIGPCCIGLCCLGPCCIGAAQPSRSAFAV